MNNKSTLCGALSGILAGMALVWGVNYWEQGTSGRGRAVSSSRSFGGLTRSQSIAPEFDKDKSLLSQMGTRLDTLLRCYSQMNSEELHSEIVKIDTKKKSDPTGTLSDAIAIMYLAYCWGRQDAEKAHKYSKSEYLAVNMALRSSSWYMLVVQAWAERDPERAYQFSCQKYLDELVRNSVEEGDVSSDEIDWDSPSTISSSPPEDLEPHNDMFNIQGAVERIESAYAKFFPNEALQWIRTRCARDDYYGISYTHVQYPDIPYTVLESLAWNHPDKLLSLRKNYPNGFDIHKLDPSTKSELALILKESAPLFF